MLKLLLRLLGGVRSVLAQVVVRGIIACHHRHTVAETMVGTTVLEEVVVLVGGIDVASHEHGVGPVLTEDAAVGHVVEDAVADALNALSG